jgi:VacB/RNase II family 3'-5' exoribonuclease
MTIDLRAVAHQAMREAGFEPEFSSAIEAELAALPEKLPEGILDLRHLLWSSVDNASSRDLDQIEVAERLPDGDIVLRVGIAEVDWLVRSTGPMDTRAAHNTTTVYTGVATFSMLPEALSTNRTSLNFGEDRVAIVVELRVNLDGTLQAKNILRALVKNYARLDYESVGPWLEGKASVPESVACISGLEEQLKLQDETMTRFLALRHKQGALNFETVEAMPVTKDGKVIGLQLVQKNRARLLIENFMIAVNTAVAEFLNEKGIAAIQRVVRAPRRWERIVEIARSLRETLPDTPDAAALSAFLERRREVDPQRFSELSLSVVKLLGPGEYSVVQPGIKGDGHFGLAVQGYTHSTAPNRRYCDVITQRLLKSVLDNKPTPYSIEQLTAIAARCTERSSAADKVERKLRKTAAVSLVQPHIGEHFDAIITGVKRDAVYARLTESHVEGRVVRGERGLDVGDRVRVQLIRADSKTGYIDFATV